MNTMRPAAVAGVPDDRPTNSIPNTPNDSGSRPAALTALGKLAVLLERRGKTDAGKVPIRQLEVTLRQVFSPSM